MIQSGIVLIYALNFRVPPSKNLKLQKHTVVNPLSVSVYIVTVIWGQL